MPAIQNALDALGLSVHREYRITSFMRTCDFRIVLQVLQRISVPGGERGLLSSFAGLNLAGEVRLQLIRLVELLERMEPARLGMLPPQSPLLTGDSTLAMLFSHFRQQWLSFV
jgi:hypothetical protein